MREAKTTTMVMTITDRTELDTKNKTGTCGTPPLAPPTPHPTPSARQMTRYITSSLSTANTPRRFQQQRQATRRACASGNELSRDCLFQYRRVLARPALHADALRMHARGQPRFPQSSARPRRCNTGLRALCVT